MTEDDARCCGSGTCIIDVEGRCWCGQQWDGEKMVSPTLQGSGACDARGPDAGLPDAD